MKPKLEHLSRGRAVAELQAKLNKLLPRARPPLKIDGVYGDKTVARVKEFQRTQRLVVDGVVGTRTWAAIDASAPAGAQASPPPKEVPLRQDQAEMAKSKGVRHGSVLVCNHGTKTSHLLLPDDPTRKATVMDARPYTNIPPFGLCRVGPPASESVEAFKNPIPDAFYVGQEKEDHGSLKVRTTEWPKCVPQTSVWIYPNHLGIDPKTGFRILGRGATCHCTRYKGNIILL